MYFFQELFLFFQFLILSIFIAIFPQQSQEQYKSTSIKLVPILFEFIISIPHAKQN